jgi:hypothetical protein
MQVLILYVKEFDRIKLSFIRNQLFYRTQTTNMIDGSRFNPVENIQNWLYSGTGF